MVPMVLFNPELAFVLLWILLDITLTHSILKLLFVEFSNSLVCVYIYIYIYMCVCVYIYIYICVCMYVFWVFL